MPSGIFFDLLSKYGDNYMEAILINLWLPYFIPGCFPVTVIINRNYTSTNTDSPREIHNNLSHAFINSIKHAFINNHKIWTRKYFYDKELMC
jgi:hypothetical protein